MADIVIPSSVKSSETVNVSASEFAKMQAQIAALNKATIVEATVAQCNICGDTLKTGVDKCPKHPNDLTNHVRAATDKEKAEAGHPPMIEMNTLVRQS